MWFVIEENVGRSEEHRGQKCIICHGKTFPYGDFYEENGFTYIRKAYLEKHRREAAMKNNRFKGPNDRYMYYIVDENVKKR